MLSLRQIWYYAYVAERMQYHVIPQMRVAF